MITLHWLQWSCLGARTLSIYSVSHELTAIPKLSLTLMEAVHHGFGKHMHAIPDASVSQWFKYLYAFEFVYTVAMATVKYSVLCFLHRIFPIVQFRRLLKACLVFVVGLTASCIFASTFQCIPVHKFWETWGGELPNESGGRCIDIDLYFLVSGAINTFTDFALLALPIPVLWSLKAGTRQKVLLTAIFTVGLVVCVVSIVRLIVLSEVDKSDITCKRDPSISIPSRSLTSLQGNYVPAACWTAAEPSIAVVSACIPSLRPLFARLLSGKVQRPKHSASHRHSLTSWRSAKKQVRNGSAQGTFNRLNEFSSHDDGGAQGPWKSNSVAVFGGLKGKRGSGSKREDLELEDHGSETEVPLGRIRAKTEV
ncbi:MAG: hypothetical protein Q9211_006563, partial [Gyalolechia sp. 1 TL-2023]